MLLSSLFREVLVLCISTKGFSHNCVKIFCSMKMKGWCMMCYVLIFSSGSLNWQYFQSVCFLPSVRLVFPSYMPHLYCCSHFFFLVLLLFYWLYDPVVIREGSLVDPVTWQSAAQDQECSFRSYWDLIPGKKQFSFFSSMNGAVLKSPKFSLWW